MIQTKSKAAPSRAGNGPSVALLLRAVALLVLLTAAAVSESFQLKSLSDPDIWWRLRTGTWIMQSHSIPRTGLFSQSSSLPWVESSWGFDWLVASAFRILGLRGLPVLLMLFQAAAAGVFFLLARLLARNFWIAALLAGVALYGMGDLPLTPVLVSILFFALVLVLLFSSGRGERRNFLALPAVFVFWASLDRQFLYGLLALGLFLLAGILETVWRQREIVSLENSISIPPSRVASVGGACALATLLSPYTYHVYEQAWQSANSAADHYFVNFHAMHFRRPQDYVLLLLVMAAFFVLGRRRSFNLFRFSLLAISSAISFRFQRDTWLVAMVAVAVIADSFGQSREEVGESTVHETQRWQRWAIAALVAVLLAGAAMRIPQSHALMAKVSSAFPVRASSYIRESHLPQPLFNAYPWGGFLTWYLPEYPVVIDGRSDLYGDAENIPYFRLMDAEIPLQSHPGFAQARTFLLPADTPLTRALSSLPDFRVVYRDEQACVLLRND